MILFRLTAKRTIFFGIETRSADAAFGLSCIFKESHIGAALDRELVPAFLTPPLDRVPSVLGAHFFSETVRAFSLNIGFIRQSLFHGVLCLFRLL